jgi:hypothetical protein
MMNPISAAHGVLLVERLAGLTVDLFLLASALCPSCARAHGSTPFRVRRAAWKALRKAKRRSYNRSFTVRRGAGNWTGLCSADNPYRVSCRETSTQPMQCRPQSLFQLDRSAGSFFASLRMPTGGAPGVYPPDPAVSVHMVLNARHLRHEPAAATLP